MEKNVTCFSTLCFWRTHWPCRPLCTWTYSTFALNLLVMMQLETSCPHSWLAVPSLHLQRTYTNKQTKKYSWLLFVAMQEHIPKTPLCPLRCWCSLKAIECEEFSLKTPLPDVDRSWNYMHSIISPSKIQGRTKTSAFTQKGRCLLPPDIIFLLGCFWGHPIVCSSF